ncbi:MAG: argininosuccinate lyase [bacterium]|nr:MAG: argininosuccinate lyase [bacterium]
MSKLWQKKSSQKLNQAIETFEVGEDYLLDSNLVEYDIYGSLAHGRMLTKIGLLSLDEFDQIRSELKNILSDHRKGQFKITIQDEDVHTKIEMRLTEKLGETGKKIHTARSRNDQVLVDTRLFSKMELLDLIGLALDLTNKVLDFAGRYEWIPMPGYTHMQLGMPSSLGMWGGAFVESLIDDIYFLKHVYDLNDQCPLGSGAGYGVSLPIDRESTRQSLGFKRLQLNALYCGNSRGKIEANIISAIVSLGMALNKMAADLLLFTTKEFDFFDVAEEITTGSSIMPQKRNLDLFELIRAKTATLLGLEISIKTLIAGLPSGYNRDFQDTKKFLMTAFETISPTLPLMGLAIEKLKPKTDRLISAHKKEIYATDAAYRLVEQGMPFRDAYRHVGSHLDELDSFDPYEVIKSRNSLGSTGNLQLDHYNPLISKEIKWVQDERERMEEHFEKLWD